MKTFVISDTHFHHKNILNFLKKDGSKLRDFSSIEEMNELMIQNWNRVVSPDNTVLHLGDVAFGGINKLDILYRLNGRKNLVFGNHEHHNIKHYLPHFSDMKAYNILQKHGIVFSHVPVHPSQLEERFVLNVHGHLHASDILDNHDRKDLRYMNVCVEKTNFCPIELDEIIAYKESVFGR